VPRVIYLGASTVATFSSNAIPLGSHWSAPSQWHYTALVGSTAEPEFGDVLDDFGNLPGGVDAAIYTENTFVPDAERIGRQHVR
jgi:hypothetical protein